MISIKKGRDLPIVGNPKNGVEDKQVRTVGLTGPDFIGLKPTMLVKIGDKVKKGTPVFEDKKNPGVIYTAPASGTVKEINRGPKRVFLSLVIETSEEEGLELGKIETASAGPQEIKEALLKSGLWTKIRQRPFGKVPSPTSTPSSIFVTAMDSNPLSFDVNHLLDIETDAFQTGLTAISKLYSSPVYLCTDKKYSFNWKGDAPENLHHKIFDGPHPAGLPGTHIHFIDPVFGEKTVWHLDFQAVIAIGKTFEEGILYSDKYVALSGSIMKEPRILKTTDGACIHELIKDELHTRKSAVISGSVLNGRQIAENLCYLGQFHHQISAIPSDQERELLGWTGPGFDRYSISNAFASHAAKNKMFDFNTNRNGSDRAYIPIRSFNEVMPLDIEPHFFLKSILTKNTDLAIQLGCLELIEEDVALWTFADCSKHNFGKLLRENLDLIEKEG